ncbi:MAG: non-homologous end-joining DNA ligase [Actinomycetota bacterium]
MTARRAGRRTIEISRPDKVLFPGDGITKADVVDHYLRVAPAMLPHLRDRPVNMQRFPEGIEAGGFYEKKVPRHFPDWVPRVRVSLGDGGSQEQVMAQDAATLAYLANQACLIPHVWLSRKDRLDHPDQMIFDLDPSTDDFEPVRDGALALREILEGIGLVPFVKTSGSKGLHVHVPLDRRVPFDEVRAFARRVAAAAAARDPDRLTTEQRKAKRRGRVFIDILRNGYGQTAVPPFAVRALPGAPVAVPVGWEEAARRGLGPRSFRLANVARRLERGHDPWEGFRRRARSLRAPGRRLDALGP